MTFSKIDPRISSYSYLHKVGDKNTELNVSFFKTNNQHRTATEQLLLEIYNNSVKPTETFNSWLLSFVKENSEANDGPTRMISDMIRMIGVKDTDLIFDMYTKLEMSRSEDIIQYFKLINQQNQKQTLFEMLDSSILSHNQAPILFKNPSDTKRFKFAKGIYPMSMSNYGGTYIIHLYEAPKGALDFKHVMSFDNNDDVYNYIEQYDLTF